ncbi:MAG: hypothetical protein QM696_14475 [Steroidobacteraceae bacterium]
MKRTACVVLAGLACSQALAVGRLADVSLIDRDSGETLQAHYHRGEYWVAGRPGAHYAIQIASRSGVRLLAVTSVDGINIISGETAGFGQRGYVFDPWTAYDIAGWRKSDSQIAAFTFTSIPKSYAARTGRPDNVGVIGVALFRERAAEPAFVPPVAPAPPLARRETASAAGEAARSAADSGALSSQSRRERPAPAPSLGTGHGRREYSQVRNVTFERDADQPNELIRIRYDSHENLVAMGVIKPAPHRPQAFPNDQRLGYVPDP